MNWLDEIIARKRSDIRQMQAEEFRSRAERRNDFRDFHAAIRRRSGRARVIAEAKSASPSAGVIAPNYDPVEIAMRYKENGAHAISVLTEQNYFGGRAEHVTVVREAVALPILRKDFIIDERQIIESVAIGADAILLIVAGLQQGQLRALHDCATASKLSALVEVHTHNEIGIAIDAGAKIIGINNRNLATLEIDLATTEELLPQIPKGITIVSESGIRNVADLRRVTAYPIDAVLVGEALMRAGAEELTDLLRGGK